MTFSIENKPSWAVFDTAAGTLSGTPGNNDVGSTTGIIISVSDGLESVSLPAFDITVSNINDKPTISGTPSTKVIQDTPYVFTPEASDADGDILIFSIENKPSWAVFGTANGTLSGTPVNNDVGVTKEIIISVSDGLETASLPAFDITVSNVNDKPVISGTPSTIIKEGEFYSFIPYTQDEDKNTLTYSIINQPIWTEFDPITGKISGIPGKNNIGVSGNIIISVSDGTEIVNLPAFDIAVIAAEEVRMICGKITGLEKDAEIWIHALSKTAGYFGKYLKIRGTGEIAEYCITDLIPAPDYRIEVSSTEYLYQVYNNRHDWESADIVNLSEHSVSDVDFILIPGDGVISGKVIFPTDAVAGEIAKIYAFSKLAGTWAEASAEFQDVYEVPYMITGLPGADDYIVSVYSDNYKFRYYNGSETGSKNEAEAILLNPHTPQASQVDFKLDRGAVISGTVFGEDVGGIRAEAWSESTNSGNGTFTDDNGGYIINGLEYADDFKIEIKKQGIAPFFYNSAETVRERTLATPVSTEYGNAEGIDIYMASGEEISGTVYNENGKPLSEIWISARSESAQTGNGVFTGEDGKYKLTGLLPANDYTVSALPSGEIGTYNMEELSEADDDKGSVVPIQSETYIWQEKTGISGNSANVDFILKLKNAYTVKGVIKDEDGYNIPNVEIDIRSDSAKFHGWNMKDHSGKKDLHIPHPYEITGLPPADDYLIVAHPPKGSQYAVFSIRNISVNSDIVYDIILKPGHLISGTVYTKDENPASGIQVTAFSETENFYEESVTDENGYYEITNAPDVSDYIITAIGEGYTVQQKFLSSLDTVLDFILEPDGAITGNVINGISKNPLPGTGLKYIPRLSEILRISAELQSLTITELML